ncbi:prenyltransferase/squalene oxidase repeat-containing protein [Kibdelosporangium aridum]|uniref:Squalene-hopene/tetraprenyl-beta-curcumene cyclase n=1 Tax=Kibdelosporangium aridum TaxID=2030 RepID=A0A1W2FY27_KIBAR|nr:prenyltransferase/squalene oxidase repeat-containing protein [Kibdelosporangium aridum]SMD26528.1 squalene-hopene/tetraprenyl-beta-curcumene cyclase [Kibdelosporangium aridum]
MDVGQLQARVEKAAERAITHLWDRQREDGSWVDRLSSSTIATALGALSLNRADPHLYKDRVESAVQWLRQYQREDGGWAMADAEWPSSPGMTAFGLAALHEIDPDRSHGAIERARVFIDENDGMNVIPGLTGEAPKTWPAALPTIWALTGLRDFEQQPDLPVETMLIPPRWRNKVSIALPAILGLGVMQARTMKRNPLRRILSRIAEPMALNWLREISGTNGGIEECPMIAGFVYLGLRQAGVGQDLQLASLRYLLETQRADGSWAIDRDLEISVTAYSIMALSEFQDVATEPLLQGTREWLLRNQWNKPFSQFNIPAGGWGWANPSGWPETEDTAVVLGVLADLGVPRTHPAVQLGIHWLLKMQNKDGSWSEWVRDTHIMNDRPCPGVTAHVIMALQRFGVSDSPGTAIARGMAYLRKHQQDDGSISSVWFRDNTHGTSRLLEAFVDSRSGSAPTAEAARKWLLANQAEDGGWPLRHELPPKGTTAEETGWAVFALLKGGERPDSPAVLRGMEWIVNNQDDQGTWRPSNVGLYFDDLCYTDDLIAHTFTLRALGRWLKAVNRGGDDQ